MTEVGAVQLEAVRRELLRSGTEVGDSLRATLIAGGRSNLTYEITDGVHRWVLRRPPVAGRTPSAHDVAREFRFCRALSSSGVPVAAPVLLCEDEAVLGAPFTVSEFVVGDTLRTRADLDALADSELSRCVDSLVQVLAALHDVQPERAGLADHVRPGAYASRQIRRWSRQWEIVGQGADPDTDRSARRLADQLGDQVPEPGRNAVLHGDYRIDNTILAPDSSRKVLAVVDWELAALGEPVADLAMMCAYRHPGLDLILETDAAWTSPRLPAPSSLADRYVAASGRDLEHWEFHQALAFYKLAVIAQGIDHRHRAGAEVGAQAGRAVADYLTTGLECLGKL